MKKIILILLSLVYTAAAFATHNRAGIITYRHISGNTYEATITTFTKESAPADRPELEIFWGDNSSDTLPRVNETIIEPDVKMNIYQGIHTYSSSGHYILHVEDPNRNAGIVNIPNSVNVPFYIESELNTNTLNPENNSAVSVGLPILVLTNNSFSFNFTFYDPDSDVLAYELITPRGANGSTITDYTLPAGASINPVTGQFNWDDPEQIGEFVFALKVSECRNGETVGTVVFDIQFTVVNENGSPEITGLTGNINSIGANTYLVQPNQTIQIEVTATNASGVSAFGEPFISPDTAIFTDISSPTNKMFEWQPATARCAPYLVVFRTNDALLKNDISVLIYVREINVEYCDSVCGIVLPVECSAHFILTPDTIPFHYVATNMATGNHPLNYLWSWGDGTYDSIPYPSHVYDTIGTYNVCLTITDLTGCSDTSCTNLTFKTEAQMGYINVFPPIHTDIKNNELIISDILLYPNPATTTLTIESVIGSQWSVVSIHNAQGQLVSHPLSRGECASLSAGKGCVLDISSFAPGIYFLTLSNEEQTLSRKFVKQ